MKTLNFDSRKSCRALRIGAPGASRRNAPLGLRGFAVVLLASAELCHAGSQFQVPAGESACCHSHGGIVTSNGTSAKLINGHIYTSIDRRSWTVRPLPFRTFLRDVTCGKGRFVAVGGSYVDEPGVIVTSEDGLVWRRQNARNRTTLHSVTSGNGLFVAVGDQGAILTSCDGIAWHRQRSSTDLMLARVTFGNGVFVVGGESGTTLTSSDGVEWRTASLGASVYVGTIHFDGSAFVVSGSGRTFTSSDGYAWVGDNAIAQNIR